MLLQEMVQLGTIDKTHGKKKYDEARGDWETEKGNLGGKNRKIMKTQRML